MAAATPEVPAATTRMMTWSPPALGDEPAPTPVDEIPVDEVKPPTVSGGLRTLKSLWAPSTSRASSAPLAVRVSYRWWVVAVGTGVAVLAVSVLAAWHYQHRTGIALAGGISPGGALTELLGLVLASIVVARMRAGEDWARTALALVGGLIALLSALTAVSSISFLGSAPALFRTAGSLLRLLQAAAVGLGIWYMFQPGAARHFDPRRRGG